LDAQPAAFTDSVSRNGFVSDITALYRVGSNELRHQNDLQQASLDFPGAQFDNLFRSCAAAFLLQPCRLGLHLNIQPSFKASFVSPFPRNALRWIVIIALSFVIAIIVAGCGSQGRQATVPAPAALPPAIPAAEPVLLFEGTGSSNSDVAAIKAVLKTLGLGYVTASSNQLDAMTEQQLGGYKLLIVPGGNSITIGQNLSPATTTMIHNAVAQYGVHYLGICAGAFFGGYSIYNGIDLTSGVSFDFYGDEYKGIHQEAVPISRPGSGPLDVYWQDGPQLSGWGDVVAKYPDGTSAIVEGSFGNGFVMFTGVHLEAPADWRAGMAFNTPLSVDLTYAGTVIQAALAGQSLPHF
jgi:biotin protein ligase-like protein